MPAFFYRKTFRTLWRFLGLCAVAALLLPWPEAPGLPALSESLSLLLLALRASLNLMLFTLPLALLWGFVLGIFSGLYMRSFLGRVPVFLSGISSAFPTFVTAVLLAFFFDFYPLGIGEFDFGKAVFPLLGSPPQGKGAVLAAVSLGLLPGLFVLRLTDRGIRHIMGRPYIFTARLKGLGFFRVAVGHLAKNILGLLLRNIPDYVHLMACNLFFVEYIFGYPGLGKLTAWAFLNGEPLLAFGGLALVSGLYLAVDLLVRLSAPLRRHRGWDTFPPGFEEGA